MASVVLDDGNFPPFSANVLVAGGAKLGALGLTTSGSVVSGSTTVNGNETINGSLTVIQPQGGGTRTAYFTDGGAGALENSLGIFNDQTATTLNFTDSGVNASLTFEGTTNDFTLTAPLNAPSLTTNLVLPVAANNTVVLGSLAKPCGVDIVAPPAGGGTRAFRVGDGETSPNLNQVSIFLNQGNTFIQIEDSGTDVLLAYDGTLSRANINKPLSHPFTTQCGRAVSIPTGTAVPVAGLVAGSIVIATQVQNGAETARAFLVDSSGTPGEFVVVFTGGGNITINWFVAAW